LKQQIDSLNKQLDTLKIIVAGRKETDELYPLLQASGASNVDPSPL